MRDCGYFTVFLCEKCGYFLCFRIKSLKCTFSIRREFWCACEVLWILNFIYVDILIISEKLDFQDSFMTSVPLLLFPNRWNWSSKISINISGYYPIFTCKNVDILKILIENSFLISVPIVLFWSWRYFYENMYCLWSHVDISLYLCVKNVDILIFSDNLDFHDSFLISVPMVLFLKLAGLII